MDAAFDSPPFLGLDDAPPVDEARVVILPVPLERTTSYGGGTARGPAAILSASTQVELWDEMYEAEPWRLGIATADPVPIDAPEMTEVVDAIERSARGHLAPDRLLVTLGGEHTVTVGAVRAAAAVHGEIGVVQLDAHADLREVYGGTRLSHACIMHRVLDLGLPSVGVGIRAFCRPEAELVRSRGLRMIWGWELDYCAARFVEMIDELPPKIYLTIDLDYYDPAIMAATGTPVPGGGWWYPTVALLELLFSRKQVVAVDVVELAPIEGLHACDVLAAMTAAKCIALWGRSRG